MASESIDITGRTRLVGVFGWPVEHSLSPPMQNAAIRALGLDWVYIPAAVAPGSLAAALAGAEAMGFVGVNLTIPHKTTALDLLTEIDDLARIIGAVNTVKFEGDGRRVGYNTDAYGFTQTIMSEADLLIGGQTVLILGGGGAGRGMAAGAAMEGARKVILANRTRERSEEIARALEPHFPETRFEVVQYSEPSLRNAAGRSQIIANATSLGLRPGDPLPIPANCLEAGHVVFDSVYTPPETPLLKAAKAAGAVCVGGLGMLARQGAKSLSIWSGLQPDEDLMLTTLHRRVRERMAAG